MQSLNIGVRGEFDIDVQKVDSTGKVISSRRAVTNGKNLITNRGMDDLGNGSVSGVVHSSSSSSWMGFCQVGSGSTPPANGNTTLNAFVAGRIQDGLGTATWVGNDSVFTTTYTFPAGTATGIIAELGLSGSTTTGNLRTHALLVDGGGTPITITVLADEQLVITYRVVFVAGADNVTNHNTSPTPTDYTITCRAAGLASGAVSPNLPLGGAGTSGSNWYLYYGATSGIGANTGVPSGTSIQLGSAAASVAAYVPGNFYRDFTVNIPINVANFADIGAVRFLSAPFNTQIGISPRLTKVSGQTLKVTLRYSWSRA